MLSTPSPIGPKQYVAILSFSTKRRSTSGRYLPNVNTPNGLWTRWRKGITGPPERLLMGLTNRAPQASRPLPMKLKPRVILLYLTHKVSVKVSGRSVGGMVYRPTSKVAIPSGTYWSPPKDKDPMVSKSGAIYWFQCGALSCDDEYIGETSRTFGEGFKEYLKDPHPFINTATIQATPLVRITSK